MSLISDTQDMAGLTQLVRSVAASQRWWADLVRYRAGERWYQRLEQTENHELWLLSWLPGQRTGFHDHFGSAGAFAVVRGELREHTVPLGHAVQGAAATKRAVLKKTESGGAGIAVAAFAVGQVRTFGPRHVHEVMNGSAQPAVSIHAYSPSLAGMRRYEMTPADLALVAVEMSEESW